MTTFAAGCRPYQEELTLDQFISEYEKLYQEGVDLFTEFNICDIHDNACQKGRVQNVESFCCHGYKYLSDACIAACGVGLSVKLAFPKLQGVGDTLVLILILYVMIAILDLIYAYMKDIVKD